jgi:hypothetical protein
MSHQLDEIVRPMVFITEVLLSDSKTLSAINTIGRTERNSANSGFIAQAKNDLRSSFSTYCNDVNFHRVTFFSEAGDIFSHNLVVYTIPDGEADLEKVPFISLVDNAMGKPVLMPTYDDPWDSRNPVKVFGIIRLIMGNNMSSYMEIQKPAKALEDIYNLNNTGSYFLAVLNGRGDVFYSQLDGGGGQRPINRAVGKTFPGAINYRFFGALRGFVLFALYRYLHGGYSKQIVHVRRCQSNNLNYHFNGCMPLRRVNGVNKPFVHTCNRSHRTAHQSNRKYQF